MPGGLIANSANQISRNPCHDYMGDLIDICANVRMKMSALFSTKAMPSDLVRRLRPLYYGRLRTSKCCTCNSLWTCVVCWPENGCSNYRNTALMECCPAFSTTWGIIGREISGQHYSAVLCWMLDAELDHNAGSKQHYSAQVNWTEWVDQLLLSVPAFQKKVSCRWLRDLFDNCWLLWCA